MSTGKVFLLGAGPGDPGLITERARRCLAAADVVLYDALVHPDLLAHCRADAERVFVGKRAGKPSERQARINERLVTEARNGRIVVRLKGGDPTLFGRGSEEAEHLAAAGIAFEVVPGVPSPLAVAAYAGIPLSHRELSSSVAFITATESAEKDESAHDWAKLATATQTLVVFMGARKLDTLMARLVAHGRPKSTPAAVVQWASLPAQRSVVGTVETIADIAGRAGIGLPALTIVGEVVRLHGLLGWFEKKPLFGKRVLVTRAHGQASALGDALRDEAAEPVRVPLLRFERTALAAGLRDAVARATSYDWVVFTSANGVDAFFGAVHELGRDARALGSARVAAIGPMTAAALLAHGIRADVVPDEYRGEAAAEAILEAHRGSMTGARVLLARAAKAREVLPDTLRAAGAVVDVVAAYETFGPGEEDRALLRRLFDEHELDVVTLTSSSTVERLVEALGPDARRALEGVVVASIGPVTTETAERLGIHVHVSAKTYTIAGLVEALVRYFSETAKHAQA